MKQVGLYLYLPEVDDYRYLIVCTDYFTEWLEAKQISFDSFVGSCVSF